MKIVKTGRSTKLAIVNDSIRVLISYATPVAAQIDGKFIETSTSWSQTTTRHIHDFLGNNLASPVPQKFLFDLIEA